MRDRRSVEQVRIELEIAKQGIVRFVKLENEIELPQLLRKSVDLGRDPAPRAPAVIRQRGDDAFDGVLPAQLQEIEAGLIDGRSRGIAARLQALRQDRERKVLVLGRVGSRTPGRVEIGGETLLAGEVRT